MIWEAAKRSLAACAGPPRRWAIPLLFFIVTYHSFPHLKSTVGDLLFTFVRMTAKEHRAFTARLGASTPRIGGLSPLLEDAAALLRGNGPSPYRFSRALLAEVDDKEFYFFRQGELPSSYSDTAAILLSLPIEMLSPGCEVEKKQGRVTLASCH